MSFKVGLADSLKLFCYQLVYLFVRCLPARQQGSRLLLVKTDEIGDFVLMRNFLAAIRESEAYRGHRIMFIGNSCFRGLYDAFDSCLADETFWLDKLKFRRNPVYRFSVLRHVRRKGFSDAINLVYSRSFRVDDVLVAVSTSSNSIAMKTSAGWQTKMERMLTPGHIYRRLEDAGDETLFDAQRNARFIGQLLGRKPEPVAVRLPTTSLLPIPVSLPHDYFVVFPGAGNKEKRWPAVNFIAVARHITRTYNFTPVICGSSGDRPETNPIAQALGGSALDLTGRTTIPEFVAVLRDARCLVSIDTSAVHLAAAAGCPVFGLFSGYHFGRFAPYPPETGLRFFAIYPDETEEKINSGRLDSDAVPMGLMSKISLEKVTGLIDRELPALILEQRERVQIN